jgi:DNA transposition AAA+ family ATPase
LPTSQATIASLTSDEVRQLAKTYIRRTGMAPADFARRVGYHYQTISQFLRNKYRRGAGSREEAICEAILRFIGQHYGDRSDKFCGTLYEIGNVRAIRDVFQRLCEKPCILLAYAPPGSGKTDVARALMPEFRGKDVEIFRIYCRANIAKLDLMHRVAIACGSIGGLPIERTLANLRFDFGTKRVALYFDEAQHLSIECLETVRELHDEMHWSLCFAGSHQLDRIFTKWAGELEQLERRITDKITIPGVTAEEAAQIIQTELPGLAASKAHKLIERSHVDLKDGDRYLSIGRVMANIRELQELIPEAVDSEPVAVDNSTEDAA